MVDFPTRRDPNGTENTWDLLLTTHPSWTSDIEPLGGISDHDIVNANISTKTKLEPKPSRKIPLWKGVDTEEFKSCSAQLSSNYFDRLPSAKSVVENWCWFRDTHCKNVSKIVPQKLIKGVNHPPWFTLDLKRMCSKKEKNYNIKPIELAKRRIGRRTAKQVEKSEILTDAMLMTLWTQKIPNLFGVTSVPEVETTQVSNLLKLMANSTQMTRKKLKHSLTSLKESSQRKIWIHPDSMPSMTGVPYPEMPPFTVGLEGVIKLLHNINVSKLKPSDLTEFQTRLWRSLQTNWLQFDNIFSSNH